MFHFAKKKKWIVIYWPRCKMCTLCLTKPPLRSQDRRVIIFVVYLFKCRYLFSVVWDSYGLLEQGGAGGNTEVHRLRGWNVSSLQRHHPLPKENLALHPLLETVCSRLGLPLQNLWGNITCFRPFVTEKWFVYSISESELEHPWFLFCFFKYMLSLMVSTIQACFLILLKCKLMVTCRTFPKQHEIDNDILLTWNKVAYVS